MKLNRYINLLAAAFISAVFFTGCGTTKSVPEDAYFNENVKDFSSHVLSNGIPVIFKKTNGGQIFVLRVIFEGGTPLVAEDKAGIEQLTLDLMFHGSKEYSYDDIQNMQYNMTFSINDSAGRDYSVAGLKCLQKDIDSVLAVFADGILNPVFEEKDFNQFMINSREGLASTLSSPNGQLGIELEKIAFGSSSYKSSTDITEKSIESIKLDDVKNHWQKMLDSGRIKIVVVANMDQTAQKELVTKLDSYFGSIEKKDYKTPVVSKINVVSGHHNFENSQAGSAGYGIAFFDCPERYDSDYVPFALALMYLDDIFFAQVREKEGAVYTIGTGVLGGKDMLGAISCYKISKKQVIESLVKKAVESFPDEKQVELKLDQYKNKYITTLFGASQSGTGVAANIITSLEYSGKPETYLKRSAEVQAVKAKEIVAAYKKYIKDSDYCWIMVSKE